MRKMVGEDKTVYSMIANYSLRYRKVVVFTENLLFRRCLVLVQRRFCKSVDSNALRFIYLY